MCAPRMLAAVLLRILALPAVVAAAALQPHDERQQRLGRGPVGVMHEERPAEPLGDRRKLRAMRLERSR